MTGGIIQSISTVLKWSIRLGIIFTLVVAFVSIFSLVQSIVLVGVNQSILGDLVALVQIWAPFNFGTMFNWMTTTASVILYFYTASWSLKLINGFLRD